MSPIITLRLHNAANLRPLTTTPTFDENHLTRRANPTVDTQLPRIRPIRRGHSGLHSSTLNRKSRQRRINRLLNHWRTQAINIRQHIRHLQDVNDIDRWSRLCFPIFFIAFNTIYWLYYIAGPQAST